VSKLFKGIRQAAGRMSFPTAEPRTRDHGRPEQRAFERMDLDPPAIGVARLGCGADGRDRFAFVAVRNLSKTGILLESLSAIPQEAPIEVQFSMHTRGEWEQYSFAPVWSRFRGAVIQAGLAFRGMSEKRTWTPPAGHGDLSFLLSSNLMHAVPPAAVLHLLKEMEKVRIASGERLMTQGEPGDALYFLQKGTCEVTIEQDGRVHRVNQVGPGAVIGEMAVVTGEPRSGTVVAQSEATLWRLDKHRFDKAAVHFPDLRSFLTEIVAARFESSWITADRRIGKYVVKRKIGSGGWSIVYRGHHEVLGMPVAVKMLRHDMAMMEGFKRKFREEAAIIARLNHPNIVTVLDIEEVFQTVFIVMEFLEGHSVREELERSGPLSPQRTVDILTQVCEGLQYAHEQGIVHQDLKPDNIAVLPGGRIKIMDFGLACPPGDIPCGLSGTIYYTPPEQIRGEGIDARSDIYSVGITAFEMLTGRRPYDEKDPGKLLRAHEAEDVPDPALFRPDLPDGLKQVVRRACSRDPRKRYQSAGELLQELRELQRLQGALATSGPERIDAASLLLLYPEKRQGEVIRLMEEFGRKVAGSGIDVRFSLLNDRGGLDVGKDE
jgi:eukaryotic-like serine/threonine-protein kinase